MNNLKVLDVTLRDGGCVNNFNFGQAYMKKILQSQEAAGIDIIELGYIDENNGSYFDRTKYVDEKVITKCILNNKKPGISYVAMIDYGKFDINKLGKRNNQGIDGIRLAFHKENRYDIISIGKEIIDKGYQFYIQPMLTLRYTDSELLEFINIINGELGDAAAFYIVDSFGEMRTNDMKRIMSLIDHNLVPEMAIGFHSHNNLQLSYSNAVEFLQFPTNRNLILDSSIMGMGKGAGNLNTEILLEHLNLYYNKTYKISPLLEVIDKVINQLHTEFYWGYAVEYYLSSVNHCSPSYASHFYDKHMLPIEQVGELLGLISEDKKVSFDIVYAEDIYRKYNESKNVDDENTFKELKDIFENKRILLIAPGKSIINANKEIEKVASENDVIVIGLNTDLEFNDYILTTRKDIFDNAIKNNKNIIVTSNILKSASSNVKILNYKRWIEVDERTHDSSTVIALNFLEQCNIKEVLLAGFDGFSVNINENYFDSNMRYPVNIEQVERRNKYYKEFLLNKKINGMNISFITESKYLNE